MGYCFTNHETVPEGIKRIACEQLDKAIAQAKRTAKQRDEAIHDARVSMKKARALLRLARSKRMNDVFGKEIRCYRDAGRLLSDMRDAAVMIAALDKLTEHYADQLTSKAFDEFRRPFVKTRNTQYSLKNKGLAEMARRLKSARRRVATWPLDDDGFCALRQGLQHSYKRGRMGMAQAQAEPCVATFHEWRKRVKDLWYQVRLLTPTWPATVKNLADELEQLADYLSDDHDLAILRQRVLQQSPQDRTQQDALVALIDQRRGELEVEAHRLGERIYVERPKDFVHRFGMYWRTWSSEPNVEPIPDDEHVPSRREAA
ncbi:MAG TPA: CHAD domain-containing protein [Nitrospiraceae bacterium]|nr:CHAD domain-containing protein [Nitrospiraceae bacterium]